MTTYLGKSCSFGLLRVPFVNCRQFMYLIISLLVLRAGCGIWLYQFLIIAYLFTLIIWQKSSPMHGLLHEMHKCCFSVVPRIGAGDAENWNRVWVWYGLLFWHTFGTVCCFIFLSDLPSTHCTTCWKRSSYKHRVCPSVRPSVHFSVVGP